MPESKITISVAEAARSLGFTLDYVYKLIWAGKIKAHKIDGKWRVEAQDGGMADTPSAQVPPNRESSGSIPDPATIDDDTPQHDPEFCQKTNCKECRDFFAQGGRI